MDKFKEGKKVRIKFNNKWLKAIVRKSSDISSKYYFELANGEEIFFNQIQDLEY